VAENHPICIECEQNIGDLLPKLCRSLGTKGLEVATAESCTAGMVAVELTKQPGSSAFFLGGVASYANSAKRDLLGVPEKLINTHGAVSSQVAMAMAEGAKERFGADVAISLTGVAGPEGGTAEKPVGMVHAGLVAPGFSQTQCFEMYDLPLQGIELRHAIRRLTTLKALQWMAHVLEVG
jgi:PncC family amidohydrolase